MTSWMLWVLVALAVAGFVTALMRQPGVVLYDRIATWARRPASQPKTQRAEKEPAPATQAG